MYECTICNCYARRSLAEIMRHIREVHRYFEDPVRCGLEGCPSTYKSYDSLRQHIYKKHRHILHNDECNGRSNDDPSSVQISNPEDTSTDGDALEPVSLVAEKQHSSMAAARFILKTRDGRKITQTTLDGILQDTRGFVEDTVKGLEMNRKLKLEALNKLSTDEIEDILRLFSEPDILDPFCEINSQYKQDLFFKEHFNYVVRILIAT